MPDAPATPPPTDPLVLRYLEHVRVEKRLAARTHTLYTLDLERLSQFAAGVNVPLLQLQTAHIRRFVAQMHSGGRSGRGIALILSGWRGFFVWATRQGLTGHNPVQDVRAPKAPKPLPKALGVDDAVRLANYAEGGADPWLEARDAAMVELLYGCGLRVGELVGLDAAPGPDTERLGRGWIDLQGAEAHVLGKGLGALGARTSCTGLCPVSPWRAAQTKKPRQPERMSAIPRPLRPLPCICATKRRMWAACNCNNGTPAWAAWRANRSRSSVYNTSVRAARRFSTRTCSR